MGDTPRREGDGATLVSRRQVLAVAALYLALAVALVGGGLLPGKALSASDYLWGVTPWTQSVPPGVESLGSNPEQYDAVLIDQPFLQYTARTLPHLPLWTPHTMSGEPFAAMPLPAAFSVFSLPAYALPFWSSLAVIAILKLFAAAMGTFLLARALGMRSCGALVAGLVFGFGFFATVGLPLQRFRVFALLPWVLLAVELVVRRPRAFVPTAALAVIVGTQFLAGMPEASAAGLLAAAAFAGWRLLATRRRGEERLRATVALGLGVLGGVGLAALTLVPFVEGLFTSYDLRFRSQFSGGGIPAKYLLGLFLPDYWGRSPHTVAADGGAITLMIDRAIYPGALALMLAVAGLAIRPTRERLGVALFLVLGLLLATELDPLLRLWSRLPVLGTMKLNYLLVWPTLAIALLAGWGMDDLTERGGAIARWRLATALGACVALTPVIWMLLAGTLSFDDFSAAWTLAWGSRFAQSPGVQSAAGADVVRLSALLEWLVPALAAVGLVAVRAWRGGRLRASAFAVLAVGLVALDLWHIGAGINPVISQRDAVQPVTPAIAYLQSRYPNRFVGVTTGLSPAFAPNLAMRYRLNDARGYDSPVDRRYGTYWSTAVRPLLPGTPLDVADPPTPSVLRALGMLSVASVLQSPNGAPLHLVDLRLAYDGTDARVYENRLALPRAFVVYRQRVVDGEDAALAAVTAPGFDARRIAVTEKRASSVPEAAGQAPSDLGAARLVEDAGDTVLVRARATRPGLLILNDSFRPGWKAQVDGKPAPVVRVNYLARGVQVPAGTHRVEFTYEPASWRIGLAISLLTAVGLLATPVVRRRRRGSRT